MHPVPLGWAGIVFLVEQGQAEGQQNLLSIIKLVQAGEAKCIKHSKAGTGLQGILCETGSGRESQNNHPPIAKLGQADCVCIP